MPATTETTTAPVRPMDALIASIDRSVDELRAAAITNREYRRIIRDRSQATDRAWRNLRQGHWGDR